MRVSTVALLSASLCAALLAASCASQKGTDPMSFDKAPLFGMIYDADNQPCPGVQLEVDGSSGPMSDIRGRFVLPDLSRGQHTITARKSGFEQLAVDVLFLNKTDVLHVQMTSFGQLLEMAQAAFADKRWSEGEGFLRRAEKLDPTDAVLRYLLAVDAYRTGAFSTAVDYLNLITASEGQQPAVLLMLADIYEKDLPDPQKAIANLEAYLKLRDDADLQKRLEALKAKVPETAAP
jgi:hypothetical protein